MFLSAFLLSHSNLTNTSVPHSVYTARFARGYGVKVIKVRGIPRSYDYRLVAGIRLLQR